VGFSPRGPSGPLPGFQRRATSGAEAPRGLKPTLQGQAILEFAIVYGAVVLPLTFMTIFVAEMLWVWHGVNEFTRQGAQYAATHCWQSDAGNVVSWMENNVPAILDRSTFQNGDAGITVQYFSDGGVTPFSADNCAGVCIPASVSVSITNYQFLRFAAFMKLPPVTIPPFTTAVPMESAGYQDASGTCVP
jgi:hypothetical protein